MASYKSILKYARHYGIAINHQSSDILQGLSTSEIETDTDQNDCLDDRSLCPKTFKEALRISADALVLLSSISNLAGDEQLLPIKSRRKAKLQLPLLRSDHDQDLKAFHDSQEVDLDLSPLEPLEEDNDELPYSPKQGEPTAKGQEKEVRRLRVSVATIVFLAQLRKAGHESPATKEEVRQIDQGLADIDIMHEHIEERPDTNESFDLTLPSIQDFLQGRNIIVRQLRETQTSRGGAQSSAEAGNDPPIRDEIPSSLLALTTLLALPALPVLPALPALPAPPAPPAPPLSAIASNLPSQTVILSTSIFRSRPLIKCLVQLHPAATLLERDISYSRGLLEADIMLSPRAAIIYTTLTYAAQRPLPGSAETLGPLQHRLLHTAPRYDELFVIVVQHARAGHIGAALEPTLSAHTTATLENLRAFGAVLGRPGSVQISPVAGGDEEVARCTAQLILEQAWMGHAEWAAEETEAELWLRSMGANTFAAAAIVEKLKHERGFADLEWFEALSRSQRIERFQEFLRDRTALDKIGEMMDQRL